jgi:hypothetical protein
MEQLLSKHPSLATDLPTLYEMAVPPAIREAKAVQKALAKMKAQAAHASVESKSTKTNTAPAPTRPRTIEEAWALARGQQG